MSKEISLETRASSAFVQGQLAEMIVAHKECFEHYTCDMWTELQDVLNEWKQAEAELQAAKALTAEGAE